MANFVLWKIIFHENSKLQKKSWEIYGYQEPIFSFVKAIGISELIKIPNNFLHNNDFENLYLISSLFGRSLFLINFDKNLKKMIFMEKIYIGERIRDLMFLGNQNSILLSLENLEYFMQDKDKWTL